MKDIQNKVRAWRTVENFLAGIRDPILRNCMRYEFEKKAVNDWGFCPAETETYKKSDEVPVLSEYEQEIYDRMVAFELYGVDIRNKEDTEKLYNETLARMCDFVNSGGNFWQLPKDLQTKELKEIYDKAFDIIFDIEKFLPTA